MGSFTVIKPRSTKDQKKTGGTFTNLATGEVITKDPVPASVPASKAETTTSAGQGAAAAKTKKQSAGTVNRTPAAVPSSPSSLGRQYQEALGRGVQTAASPSRLLQTAPVAKAPDSSRYSLPRGLWDATKKGANQFAQAAADTLAMGEDLFFLPFELLAGEERGSSSDSGIFNTLQRNIRREGEAMAEKSAENVSKGGKAAQLLDKYGTATVAAVPQAVLAMLTGGGSAAAQTSTALAQTAGKALSPSLSRTVSQTVSSMAKNPQYWTSFAHVLGSGYEQALADGASPAKAVLYAVGNGLMNAAVEISGGVQTMPGALQGGEKAWKALVDSALEEGNEEVIQGVIERGMQNLVYGRGNPLSSTTDPSAILNPRTALEEWTGGAVVGGVLGAGQTAVQAGVNAYTQNQVQKQLELMERAAGLRKDGPGGTQTGPETAPGPPVGTDTTQGANGVTEASEARQRQEVGNQLLDLMRQVQRQREAEQQRAAPPEETAPAETTPRGVMEQEIRRLFGTERKGRRINDTELSDQEVDRIGPAYEAGLVGMDARQRLFEVNPEEHIDQRDYYDVGSQKINAFQFDHPQLHPYYTQVARDLLYELSLGQKGGELYKTGPGYYDFERTKRVASPEIETLLDEYGLSYGQIETALRAIVEDHGQENFAAAKRVELVLDRMLSEGYRAFDGRPVAADEGYIAEKARIAGSLEEGDSSQAFVNPDAPGDDGLGAADAGTVNTDYDRLQAQNREFFPEGPNPVRPVDVPRTDFEGRPISQTASTVMGAKAIPDEVIPMIEQMIASGRMSYEKVSNKSAMNRARARIEEIGFQGALAEFREAVRVGKTSKNMQVLGQALINNAANAGDGNALAELLTLYQITGTNTAQAEQARTLFRQLSPESQLYGIQKSVSELNRTLERRQGPDRLNQDDAGTVIEALEEARQEALRQLETMTAAYENVVDAMREGYRQADAEESESPGWVEQLARDLAKSAGRRAGGGRTASASIYRTLLGDLNAFMSEHVAAQRNSSQKRTAADKIADLFANREEYARAWESAKERLRETYKDSPAALEALEDFLQASIGYNGVGPDTTMLRAVTEAALENDVTIKDAVIRGQYDRAALVNQIADTLIQRTGAKGSDQTVVRNAVERWVQNRIEDSGKTAGDYIRQDVNRAVGEIGLKMSEIIRSSPGSQEAAARQIANLLTERYGLSEEGARRVAEAATADFRFSVEETSRRALDQMFKERPRRARKELSKRMEELINLGAFSSEYSDAAVKRVLGVENIQINQELLQKFLDQTDQEGRNAVMEEILQSAADQMPGSWRGIFDEARYLSMLFNPKTHRRNVIFNAAFQPFVMAKNRIGAVGELAAQKAGVNPERTKSVIPANPFGQLAREARADWKEFRDFLDNSHYSDSTGKSQIAKRASPYKNVKHFQKLAAFLEHTLGTASKLNMKALSTEDGWFKAFIYSQSLAGYLQANGVKSMSEADPELLSRARNYAAQEALRNTFNDRNSLSDAVASLARLRNSDNKYLRGFSYFTEGALPFKRTPVNIGVRAYEYSVGGIADLAELIYEGSTGRATSESITKHIDRIAANVSGASLLVLGFMAAGAGYLRGGDDEDDRQRAFDDLVGHQSYSLEFPNGTSVTLGQAAPASIPLFMGVELEQALEDGTISPEEAASLLKNLSEPMLQMSVLQSVNDLFETAALAKQRDKNVAASLAVQALTNYFTQAIPTMGGQIERTGEDQRMSTYVDKNSLMPVDLQKILGKTSQKIPGWDYHQIPYIDLWGREEETGGPAERAYNNFLNPFYMSEVRIGQVEEELQRLKDATGDSTVLPNWVGKSITVGKETKQLTADEYVQYARTTGQTRRQVLEQLMDSAGYRKLSDEGKAKAVQAVYEYADGVGKMAVSSWKPSSSHILSGIQKSMLPPAEYILYKQFSDRDGSGNTSQAESSQTLMELDGLTDAQRGKAWSAMNNKGETEEARARKETKNPFTGAMAKEGFDPEEALKFWQIYDGTGTKEDPYTKQEKQTDIMEALGLSSRMEAISLWNLMEKSLE